MNAILYIFKASMKSQKELSSIPETNRTFKTAEYRVEAKK